jgi:hypothetical protein
MTRLASKEQQSSPTQTARILRIIVCVPGADDTCMSLFSI